MVKSELVRKQLKELKTYLQQLEKYKSIEAQELSDNLELAWVIERGLQLSIQLILDIGNHILAEEGIMVENYSEIFDKLVKIEVLPEGFADKIKGMAGFRNILVHDYLEVDKEIVAQVVNNNLDDFYKFAQYVYSYLEEEC
jgi:uncharacterized protein YutE (UPF0331/DUF86 family)